MNLLDPLWPLIADTALRASAFVRLANIGRYAPRKAASAWFAAVLVIGVGLVFGADEKEIASPVEPPVAVEIAPESARPAWAKEWELQRLILPRSGPAERSNVRFRKSDGTETIFSVGLATEDEPWVEKLDWLGNPPRAQVTLRKGQERAVFSVDPDQVERQLFGQQQIEIEARFIEISETAAKRLKVTTKGVQLRDRAGLDALIAGLAGGEEMSLLTAPQHEDLVRVLTNGKGRVDVLSTPRVTTKSGQRAVIEIIREFRYPTEWSPATVENGMHLPITPTAFETRNCGVTLELEPMLNEAGTVTVALKPQVVEFLGYTDLDSGKSYPASRMAAANLIARTTQAAATPPPPKQAEGHRLRPIFSARQVETSVTLLPGHAVLLLGASETEKTQPFSSPAKNRRLVILVSARLINAGNFEPAPAAKNPPKPAAPGERLPGIVVPEKPGFVISPYAPDQGYIDVRGFPPGTEVKDPYSGKMLLVP